ncbi:MAG: hypothetical protein GKR94_21820 [Gammaproteobacteria bacterium]|nr:hypothetical protein [Gammaproteobacteria bacterium]
MTDSSSITSTDVAKAIRARVWDRNKQGKAVEREARAEDILSYRVDGAEVIAITRDGRKHRGEISE